MATGDIVLKQYRGQTHATEFIRTVDLWCYPGEKTQAVVVQRSCLQHLLDKSRDAMNSLQQLLKKLVCFPSFSDTHSGKASAHPKTKAERDYSTPEAPPALAAPSTWASFNPASSYRPSASFRLVSFNSLRHRLWHLRCPCRPMPPPSRRPLCPPSHGQCFDVEALVCVVLNTNPCHRPNVPQRTINLTNPPHQITNHHAVAQCSPPAFFCDSREIRKKR